MFFYYPKEKLYKRLLLTAFFSFSPSLLESDTSLKALFNKSNYSSSWTTFPAHYGSPPKKQSDLSEPKGQLLQSGEKMRPKKPFCDRGQSNLSGIDIGSEKVSETYLLEKIPKVVSEAKKTKKNSCKNKHRRPSHRFFTPLNS